MTVSPTGGGNITSPQFTANPTVYPANFTCSVNYTLTAVPAAGYEFIDWVINATSDTANPVTISVADGAKNVTAFFRVRDLPNTPPTADAGDDQFVMEGDVVVLDGSGSSDPDNDIRSYLWTQTGGTPTVALSNPAVVSPAFTAPEVGGDSVALIFQLTVEDIPGETDTDTVTITVNNSGIDPPTADAGPDQEVSQRSEVTLDATGSFDPNNNIISYSWEQIEGEEVRLSDPSAEQPKFTAPTVVTDPKILVFQLTVGDSTNRTDDDTVTITVVRGQIGGSSSSAGCFINGAAQ